MVYYLAGGRKCPDWLRVPPSVLFIGYRGKVVGGMKLTIFPPSSAAVKNDWSCMLLDLTLHFIPADRLHAQKGHCCHILMRPQWKDLNIIPGS